MRVAIAGASGLVGTALAESLAEGGVEVLRLVRGEPRNSGEVRWDPAAGVLGATALAGCDAVVNLSGENVADGAWSAARKKRILDSRIDSTRTLVQAMAAMEQPPKVFISTSAIGYYGNRGDEVLTERASLGSGFLAEVCRDWEAEAMRAKDAGVRVVCVRLGVVLTSRGGALAKMLTPFRLGLGGPLGSGEQYMSWITLHDVVRAIRWCISREDIHGPVNLVAPQAVTNREFTKALAGELRRPAFMAAPAFALRLAMGQMADEMLLSSARVSPAVLHGEHFDFEYPKLEEALHALIHRGI